MPGRCFLAFDLPAGAVSRLEDATASFVSAAPEWAGEKWVDPRLLHVTLKFIGPLDDAAVPACVEALADACRDLRPATLEMAAVRAVPSSRRASMVWATLLDSDGSCATLACAVDEILASRFGVPVDTRAFAPHVTLARARKPKRVPPGALEDASARLDPVSDADGEMSVRSLTLYASTLGPGGPTYEPLGSVPVGAD